MPVLHDWELTLRECRGMEAEADVVDVARILQTCGLAVAEGAWTPSATPRPAADLRARLEGVHFVMEAGRRAARTGRIGPLVTAEEWRSAVVRPEQPDVRAQLVVARRGLATWQVTVTAATWC